MNIGESRDFKIGGRVYRDTLIARDVHQISNPATGHCYGEVVQIPADGRTKGYYLAGPQRRKFTTWEAAVPGVEAQHPDPNNDQAEASTPAKLPDTPPAPAPVAPAPDTTGWVTIADGANLYGRPHSSFSKMVREGAIPSVRVPWGNQKGFRYLVPPPPAPAIVRKGVGRPRTTVVPTPPAEVAPVAAAEVAAASEPKITIRPAHTKVRELEAQLAELQTRVDALTAASKRQSWLDRIFGGRL